MSSFLITNHYPDINQLSIPRNPVIKVYFNREINISSITYRTISLHDSLYATIPGDVGYDYSDGGTTSGIADILTFTPSVLLNSNSKYRVYVHKTPDGVISSDNDPLVDTYRFSFFTGSGTVDISEPTELERLEIDLEHALDLEDYELAAEIKNLINDVASGVIPSGLVDPPEVIGALEVTTTSPEDREGNVLLSSLRFIKISFNDAPAASGVAMGDYIDVSHKSVISD